jgi:hypothetical protein
VRISAYTATRKSTRLSEGAAHFDSFSSQAARGYSCTGTACSLCSLNQTTHYLIAAWNHRRPWQNQVGACGGKRALTTATHHPQTSGETTSMYESRSCPSRVLGQDGSGIEASPVPCPARHPAALASRSISFVLETQVKGPCSTAEDISRDHCLDQGDGSEESTVGR